MNVADQSVSFEFSFIDLLSKAAFLSCFVFFHVISLFCVSGFC
ncbi:hypothetical protein FP742_20175 [Vibrio parahaemolyticus]|uniref:Uncharacterized protein n=2 Tax=Vibrio parahaemolyticus TaxID=670 RepID=A0A227JHK4_VIBPH|nr:hypothetical protein A6J30_21230 [Vibrio parahaemolyticus]EDM61610.1 conserved hypothetical protein [Vibrio parahaemolyticus AQ3810]EFO35475.1 conserved hypothetical protein [Vibrio parahaemolyticus Peru-466]EFO41987.1 conserved hypothetical protein [Vibrio parahaemolyticus AN-5034]EFO49719.1 conserved hypothetical protein [Vibrio parahaemolyticus K5030]EQL91081.1 putative membrane protein [Vibrio parahaemolyticus VP250]EQM00509.1 putative membrane protein [Vibrio parahaemolyticus NIHCB060